MKFGTILKYHERYFYQISRTNHALYYFFILQPEKFSLVTPSVYSRRVVSLRRRVNWFQSSRPSWS